MEFSKYVSWESLLIVELDRIEKNLKCKSSQNVAAKKGKINAPKIAKKIKRKGDYLKTDVEKKRKIDPPKVAKVCAKRKGAKAEGCDAKKKKIETVKEGSKKSVNKRATKAEK